MQTLLIFQARSGCLPASFRDFDHAAHDGGPASGSVANFVPEFQLIRLGSAMEGGMFKGRHFERPVILLCVRWYLAHVRIHRSAWGAV